MKKRLSRYIGLLLFGVALLFRFFFWIDPDLFDSFYLSIVFPFIRKIQFFVGGVLPFSGYYLLIILALLWPVVRFPRKQSLKNWSRFGLRLLNLLGGTAAFFLILWGFNYVGPELGERIGLETEKDKYDVVKLYFYTMNQAMEQRKLIPLPNDTASVEDLPIEIPQEILEEKVKKVLEPFGYPISSGIVLRKAKPPGALRRLGILGIYNPFTGEANMDASSGVLSGSFTAAHEMAHALGITREAEANFVAYLALIEAEDPILSYSAAYALWRYVAREVNRTIEAEDRELIAAAIPLELQIDRAAIWARAGQYRPYFPQVSEKMNDQYLKLQGVEEGTEDYNAFVSYYLKYFKPSI